MDIKNICFYPFRLDHVVCMDLVPSLFELLEIVTQQDPTFVPDVQQILSEVQ